MKSYLLLVFLSNICCLSFSLEILPEKYMNAGQIIVYNGYPVEEHVVLTIDGYILGMQRIPYGRMENKSNETKPAILLMHGLLSSSVDWIANMPEQSLAFILADSGYDVWLGNVRGNVYSQRHLIISKWKRKFWEFSWQEMAEYDLPAMIDYVLAITDNLQLHYVGYSQGSLMGFALFSSNHEYGKKIKTFFALAPVSTVGHVSSPIRVVAPFTELLHDVLTIAGDYTFGDVNWMLDIIRPVCQPNTTFMDLCKNTVFFITGPEEKSRLNETRIPVYFAHNPAGTSMKNIIHFGQMVNSGKMQKYDYGIFGNIARYGSGRAAEYDVRQMQVRTVMFWSNHDELADQMDVMLLITKLRHQINFMTPNYSHVAFLYALNAKEQIYDKIVNIIQICEQTESQKCRYLFGM